MHEASGKSKQTQYHSVKKYSLQLHTSAKKLSSNTRQVNSVKTYDKGN